MNPDGTGQTEFYGNTSWFPTSLLHARDARDLAALDKPVQRRVAARIEALAENPRPAGVTKQQGEANAWRIRVGDYRILYAIEDRRLVIFVIKIGHRREVYR